MLSFTTLDIIVMQAKPFFFRFRMSCFRRLWR